MCRIKIQLIRNGKVRLMTHTDVNLSDSEFDELVNRIKILNINDGYNEKYRIKLYSNHDSYKIIILELKLPIIKEIIQTIINDISSN